MCHDSLYSIYFSGLFGLFEEKMGMFQAFAIDNDFVSEPEEVW